MKFNKKKSSIKNVKLGKNVTIIEPVNLYGCEIKDNCFIGPFVEIQENVTIGKNTRVQSHSFICSNVNIGQNCFVGHSVCFVNDKFSNKKIENNKKNFLKTIIGSKVLIGSNSTILPIKVNNQVIIGAGSVVTRDCKENKVYAGNPAKEIKKNS